MGIAAQCLHGARVCVIPHPANDYQPLALRHRPLLAVSFLLLTAKAVAIGVVGLMPAPAELSTITEARILQLTNAERTRQGLQALTMNDQLNAAARQKASDMLERDYFAHISPQGVTPWYWMHKAGYRYQVAGENLAIDFTEAEDVVAAWMASPTHRANIVHGDYTETGIGVQSGEFEGGTSIVVVHMFGLPQTPATAAPALARAESTPAQPPAAPKPSPKPVSDRTAPAAPLVTVAGTGTVRDRVELTISAEAKSVVALWLNTTQRAAVTIPASGAARVTVELTDVPDGAMAIRAVARDQAGNRSRPSDELTVTKDTRGPDITEGDISYIVSPATDVPLALVRLTSTDFTKLAVRSAGVESIYATTETPTLSLGRAPLQLAFFDAQGNAQELAARQLLPSFSVEGDTSYLRSSGTFSRFIWRVILSTALVLFILLSMAVLIRIQIQRPRMIAHALFVLLLAGVLLWL